MSQHPLSKRTQAERTRVRKKQIVGAAMHFFGQNGYHGTRLADIARAAGVTEPGLLHHYPGKVQLLMDVLAERERVDHERFNPTGGEPANDLLSSLQALVEYNQTIPGLVQLFTVLASESIDEQHPGHAFFLQHYQHGRQQSVEALRQAQSQGQVRDDIPAEDLAVLVYALMDGLQIQWLYEPDKVNMTRLFEHFTKLVRKPSDAPRHPSTN